ncbi:hypothetical protein ASG22_11615 [Chryseobacterium sp. Leaf405]|uniref:hypothetical protein n=1 Tax=Chryseobacterium sp. Leaf405 TaxID=1736367 RepID=UPI0006FE01C1|nr:hypothetical protein [Chryseobacterium sp. Leaf405]KQT24634.1 hypothetical protein ASG22_11615 [Chryseobacterium sp. Leaf405]
MNTFKDNFEIQVKKQIDEREITPSRDLWSEIEFQLQNNVPPKSRLNWYLVAACLVLTFSLGAVLFFFTETSKDSPKMVQEKIKPTVNENVKTAESIHQPITIENPKVQEVKTLAVKEKKGNQQIQTAPDEVKVVPKENISEKITEKIQISEPKVLAQIDSSKVPAKKKRYVDPSTLLFSVEHKDVIEKTKEGSNVATIDLNIK